MTIPSKELSTPPRPDRESGASSPEWLPITEAELQRLLGLRENWNSYGARAISPAVVRSAMELLPGIVRAETPQPVVVPTVRGGVQLEWHTGGIDLEITLDSPDQVCVFYADGRDGSEWEGELSPADKSRLAELTGRLSPPRD